MAIIILLIKLEKFYHKKGIKLKYFIKIIVSVFICFSGEAQINLSSSIFKKIETTKVFRQKLNKGINKLTISEKNVDKYDTDGKRVENTRTTYYSGKPYESSKTLSYYDDTNKLAYSITHIINDSITYKTHYYYKNNLLMKEQFQYENGHYAGNFSENFFYDKNSKLEKSIYQYLETHIENNSIKMQLKLKSTYDKNGLDIISDWTASDSTYKYNKIFHFRDKRGLIKKPERV